MSSALGTKKAKINALPTLEFVNFLNKYDTSNVDNTLGNLTEYASQASQNLGDLMGNYNFSVNASDEARNQAQEAVYNAYMDKLTPQFEQQTSGLSTSLINKGLPVGSEAYQRAMNDLQQEQNDATSQAAYQSVLAGQNAYTQDLQNQIAAGNFGNTAQQSYINQLLSALQGSLSSYDVASQKYAANQALAAAQQAAAQQAYNNRVGLISSAIGGASSGAGAYFGAKAASDKRLKENINKLDEVDGINIYEFNYIGEDEKQVGVIAQEMREKCPESIIENYENSGYLGVDYSKLPEKVQNKIKELR